MTTAMAKKRQTEAIINQKAGNVGYRETKDRASRFNLTDEESLVYHKFAQILASFDEETRLELLETVGKDAQDIA